MEYLEVTRSITDLLHEGKLREAEAVCKAHIERLAGNRKTREHFQNTANNPNCISTFTR